MRRGLPSLLIALLTGMLIAGCAAPSARSDPLAIAIVEYDDDQPRVIWLANDYGWLIEYHYHAHSQVLSLR